MFDRWIRVAAAALLLLAAAPAAASPSTFVLSGWTADAGKPETFTITRTAGIGGQAVIFATADGTAKAGVDYVATKVTIRFGTYQKSAHVQVATMIDPAAAGKTLQFGAAISVKGIVVSNAGASIVEPPAPAPVPAPAPLAAGMQVKIVQACPAINRPETAVVGDIYTIVEFANDSTGAASEVVLTNAAHPGDGYFAMYLPLACVAPAP